ncbi:hypothetical protein BC937DRAFT_92029 [Endogone sp. FLAS-F59071]|nr:hypothetical protein BC937DRAFT_92029 [Endogone sp. FLAS-F59071]|eukprot:RUS15760.1 hypothetical protein BC937DRAFT_92029 [Endogone sp. FLAS-F59071]
MKKTSSIITTVAQRYIAFRIFTSLSTTSITHIHSLAFRQLAFTFSLTQPYPKYTRSVSYRAGDWLCPSCDFHNLSSRRSCLQCGAPVGNARAVRPGDWVCEDCGIYNFQSRLTCLGCARLMKDLEKKVEKAEEKWKEKREKMRKEMSKEKGEEEEDNGKMEAEVEAEVEVEAEGKEEKRRTGER